MAALITARALRLRFHGHLFSSDIFGDCGIADVLAASAMALSEAQVAEHFKGQGPWKKRLPQILDTLEAVGRARKISANEVTLWSHA